MNIIPFLVGRLFPSRIVSVFLAWIGCIFTAASNYCLFFFIAKSSSMAIYFSNTSFPHFNFRFYDINDSKQVGRSTGDLWAVV